MSIHEDENQIAYLKQGLDFYKQIGIPALIDPPTEENPYSALILQLSEIGSRDEAIQLEISFVPGLHEASQEGVYLLQTFAELKASVEPEHASILLPVIAEINTTLPIGAFGLFPHGGALYYKHNAMLHRSWITGEDTAVRMDRQNGLILHQLQLYTDTLLQA